MGCHFMRITSAIPAYVRLGSSKTMDGVGDNVLVKLGRPPAQDELLVRELKDYLWVNLNCETRPAGQSGTMN
eukprot:1067534-Pyramimonas_sp.AAC.1